MRIPLSISEAAGLRIPVEMDWKSYSILVPSTYLVTERHGEKMVEVLSQICDAIDKSDQMVGSTTFRPDIHIESTLRYEVAIRPGPRNSLDEEAVLSVSFMDIRIS